MTTMKRKLPLPSKDLSDARKIVAFLRTKIPEDPKMKDIYVDEDAGNEVDPIVRTKNGASLVTAPLGEFFRS